jgi:hypothetical protein
VLTDSVCASMAAVLICKRLTRNGTETAIGVLSIRWTAPAAAPRGAKKIVA